MANSLNSVIVGASIPVVILIIKSVADFYLERMRLNDQQESEKKTWIREETRKEREYLREVYQNSLTALNSLISLYNEPRDERDLSKRDRLVDQIHNWVTILMIRHASPELKLKAQRFTNDPDEVEADELKSTIMELLSQEASFFLNEPELTLGDVNAESVPDMRSFLVFVEDEYRKTQLAVEGVDIKTQMNKKIRLSDMKKDHRECLIKVYFDTNKNIPKIARLHLPEYDSSLNKINIRKKLWKARLNPEIEDTSTILDAWVKDFKEALADAERLEKGTI